MTSIPSYQTREVLLPKAFFMTDEKRCPDPASIIKTLPDNCGVVFRNYQDPDRDALAFRLSDLCKDRGLVFLVAGDVDLARKVGADGLHLPNWALDRHSGTMGLTEQHIVTASAHNIHAIRRAVTLGADAVFIAPAFATESHKGQPGLGLHRLQRLCKHSPLPFYLLGGIKADTVKRLPPLKKMAGIAGISFFME